MPRYAIQSDEKILKGALYDAALKEKKECYYYNSINKVVNSAQIEKDQKIEFDWENFAHPESADFGDGHVGFRQLNGFCVALCCAGGDWEAPVFFVLYLDDKNKVRMYIPTLGNSFNKFNKCAFGSEDDDSWVEEHFNNWGLTDPDEIDDAKERFIDHIYDTVNEDAMLADIEGRIAVKGNETVTIPQHYIDSDKERWNFNPTKNMEDTDCDIDYYDERKDNG